MNTEHLGSVLKTRPTLQRFQDSPVTRVAVFTRWAGWLIAGWIPTAVAATVVVAAVVSAAGWLLVAGMFGIGWWANRYRFAPAAGLAGVSMIFVSVWATWNSAPTPAKVALILLVGVFPVDVLAGRFFDSYRRRRWWAEFRRGFPVFWAIMAAKSTHVQGVMDGEQQLREGRRPILDHPAITGRPAFDDDTAWVVCSVPPGRDRIALTGVIEELAASFTHVQRLRLQFVDDFQTFGYLVVKFGYPLLDTETAPTFHPSPIRETAYRYGPHIAIAAVVAAAAWTAFT